MRTWFGRTMVGALMCVCAACGQTPSETYQLGSTPPRSETDESGSTPPTSETYQLGSTPYQLSATVHHAPSGCGDRHSARDELYANVRVMDPELEGRIGAVERRTEQLLGSISMTHAEWDLEELAQREFRSGVEPLTEAERLSLARLREAELNSFGLFRLEMLRAERALTEAEQLSLARLREAERASAELEALEARVPLSAAGSEMLRQGEELLDTWNRLASERRWMTNPRSMRVYENERLDVGVWEDDFFADDKCLAADIMLDRAILDSGSLEIGDGVMTLEFTAFHD